MRIAPIEEPNSLIAKIAYWVIKRRVGKVITPAKVIYARVPAALKTASAISKLMESGLSIDAELRLLLQTYVAALNNCVFCVDIAQAMATAGKLDLEKFRALEKFRDDGRFSEKERAALEYVEEATRYKKVSDNTFNTLKRHFSDTEIVEITLVNAVEHYYNMTNLPLEIESDGLCALPAPNIRKDELTESVAE